MPIFFYFFFFSPRNNDTMTKQWHNKDETTKSAVITFIIYARLDKFKTPELFTKFKAKIDERPQHF